jgi:CRISPR/Cas system-associated endonuclease Cas1
MNEDENSNSTEKVDNDNDRHECNTSVNESINTVNWNTPNDKVPNEGTTRRSTRPKNRNLPNWMISYGRYRSEFK